MNAVWSGLMAGSPLCVLGALYSLVRYESLAVLFQEGDAETAAMSGGLLRLLLLAMFGLSPLMLALIARFMYGAVGSQQTFMTLALSAASIASILAVISRTPLMGDKIVMNFVVALVLGLLVPRLAGS